MPILPILLTLVLAMPAAADSPYLSSSDPSADAIVDTAQTHGMTSTDSSAENGTPTHSGTSTGSSADGADSCATNGSI